MQSFRLAALAVGVATGLASLTSPRDACAASDPAADLRLPVNVAAAMRSIDAERIRAHVRFLADDLLEGRGTGARGGDIAAKYIAAQFALDGLRPAGGDGGYIQKVEITGVRAMPATSFSPQTGHGKDVDLKMCGEYVTSHQT